MFSIQRKRKRVCWQCGHPKKDKNKTLEESFNKVVHKLDCKTAVDDINMKL